MCFVIFTDWLVLRHSNAETIQSFQSQRLNSKNETRITWMVIFVNVLFTKDLFCNDRWRNTLMMRDCTRPSVMPTLHQSTGYLSLHWGCLLTLDQASFDYKPHPWPGFVWLQLRPIVGLSDYSQVALILIQCDYDQKLRVCLTMTMTNHDRLFQKGFWS